MVPAPKKLEAKLGTNPVLKRQGASQKKVQETRAEQSPGWVGPGCGRTRNALLRWHLTTADGTDGDPRVLASPQMRLSKVWLPQRRNPEPGNSDFCSEVGVGVGSPPREESFPRETPRKVGGDPEASTDRVWGWPVKRKG